MNIVLQERSRKVIETLTLAKVSNAAAKAAVEDLTDRISQFRIEIEEKRVTHLKYFQSD